MKLTKKLITYTLLAIILINCTITNSTAYAENNFKKNITDYVNDYLKRTKVPGINIAITNSKGLLYQKNFNTSGKPSPIGSLTKSFTSLAILQQVEKGTIALDDKVIDYIPWYTTFDKTKSDTITIAMLLNNSSGLPHNLNYDDFFINRPIMDYENHIKKHENIKLAFTPGSSYSYSNEGFVIAGYILELVTGISYEDYIKKYILEPLDMQNSTTSITELMNMDYEYGNLPNIDRFIPATKTYCGYFVPAGSEFVSTTNDLSKYAMMLLNKGSYKNNTLISKDTFEKYIAKGINPFKIEGKEVLYQSGWMHIKDSQIMFHFGQTMSASSIILIDKKNDIAISILNSVPSVINEDDSKYNLAFHLLSYITNESYKEHIRPNIPLIDDATEFIANNPDILGQYISSNGITNQ